MSVGVATLVAGRRGHLANLLAGLARQTCIPEKIVVVRMDSAPVEVPMGLSVEVVDVAPDGAEFRLAAARNAGVRALGTDQVVLLDVDCIPARGLIAGYGSALTGPAGAGLVCGEVRYLAPGIDAAGLTDDALRECSEPHAARPVPAPGDPVRNDLHALAWTTSLGLTRGVFDRLGGFDERFVGYGGEDTDFAERARLSGVGVWWTGDATAFHQDHGGGGLPSQHVAAIVRNARLFQQLHGWWPMLGWLEEFDRQRLVEFDEAADLLRVTP